MQACQLDARLFTTWHRAGQLPALNLPGIQFAKVHYKVNLADLATFPAGVTPGDIHKPTLLPVVVMKMSADSRQSSRGATVKPAQPQQRVKGQVGLLLNRSDRCGGPHCKRPPAALQRYSAE